MWHFFLVLNAYRHGVTVSFIHCDVFNNGFVHRNVFYQQLSVSTSSSTLNLPTYRYMFCFIVNNVKPEDC